MRAYFLSDIHLKDPESKESLALLRFLKSINTKEEASDLFLMGDIFDLWLSNHDYFVKKWFPINRELVRLKMAGVKIHYFEGNHDLYLADYYRNQLGFTVYEGPQDIEWNGKKLWLCVHWTNGNM